MTILEKLIRKIKNKKKIGNRNGKDVININFYELFFILKINNYQ